MTDAMMLHARPLTRDAFAPFGDVVEIEGRDSYPINQGTADRYHDLAQVDVSEQGGRAVVSVVRSRPESTPVRLRLMERHPLASQAFIPLTQRPFLIVVAPSGPTPAREALRAFLSNGRQGINYRKGVWHHPLIALEAVTDFVVVDREGPGDNCEETAIRGGDVVVGL